MVGANFPRIRDGEDSEQYKPAKHRRMAKRNVRKSVVGRRGKGAYAGSAGVAAGRGCL